MFKKVIYNTGSQIVGKAVTASTTLFITLLIGRALGEAGYGDFTKIFVFVGYFYILADFGLNTIYIKHAEDSQNEISLLKSLFGLRLVFSLLLAVVAILISFFIPYDPETGIGYSPLVKTGIVIASLTILTHGLFTTANAYFQKILRYDLSTTAAVAGTTVVLLGAILTTINNWGLLGYTSSYVFGGITFVMVAYWQIQKKTKRLLAPDFDIQKIKSILREAWPIGLALILNLVYFRIDTFILANTRSSGEVGIYGLAYQFFEASLAIPIFFANALYPLLNKLHNTNPASFKQEIKHWAKLLTGFSILLALALTFVSYLIPIIYNGKFTGSTQVLQILALGMPFFFLSALLWHIVIIYNKQKYLTIVYAVGAAFNLATNLIFIPRNGYMAAAVITVISEVLIMILLTIVIWRSQSGNRSIL